ncbi:hypothetical protein DPMN_177647 [Dreissena polymorpha]|uniref:Uncharacterized protein n=1 Tax=Dreissena polymorpha TaxID=45954 RepID=A0A9D4IKQ8_DREPO|nr:hypothetical protein DPMN_177647 [Dreissena polymorpha]
MAISNAAPVENVDNVVPLEIANCINRLTPLVNTTDPKKVPGLGTPEDVYVYCLQQFLWRSDMVRWEDYNITKKDKDFVNGLIDSVRIVANTFFTAFKIYRLININIATINASVKLCLR